MRKRFRRGFSLAQASFTVLKHNPKLTILPVISFTIFLLVVGSILASLMPQFGLLHKLTGGIWEKIDPNTTGVYWVNGGAIVVIYGLTVVGIFINVALFQCVRCCLAGKHVSIRAGLAVATARLPQILGWAALTLTVGFAICCIEGLFRKRFAILAVLFGNFFKISWAAITYFVVPVMVVERVGPITAVRRSSTIMREKWGESLAGEAKFGAVGFLFFVLGAAIFFIGLAIKLSFDAAGMRDFGAILMVLGVVSVLANGVLLKTLETIFMTGVFIYTTTGTVPPLLDAHLAKRTFRASNGSLRRRPPAAA
jgi:hypothetical protein